MDKKVSRKVLIVSCVSVFLISLFVFYSDFTKRVGEPIECSYSVADPEFTRSLAHLLGPEITPRNAVRELLNGDQIFPAMLQAIHNAKKSVTLETYIWESGKIGSQFRDALAEKAKAGVKVHIIVDGMGTLKLKDEDIELLRKAGAKFVKYGRDRWYKIKWNLNHRTHRKILVVDGRIGFTGGVCIADKWLGNADKPDLWRDTHYQVEGPAVLQLQGIFADNWLQTTGEVLHGPDYFPELNPDGETLVQGFASGPREHQETGRLVHLFSIAAARKHIRLAHAYFVPDDLAIQALLDARKRGVKVEIIVPGKNDSAIGRAASRSRWDELLKAGVEFYLYQPSLLHCKVMIVDDLWVTSGSINFDNRSFRINDEVNINVLDKKFAGRQVAIFEEDKKKSRPLTLQEHESRSAFVKGGDWLAGWLRWQL
jgi:cardiolipin synthase